MIVTCPRCFTFDDVAPPRRTPDGRTTYTCTDEHDGAGPHTWSIAPEVVEAPTGRAIGRRVSAAPSGSRATSASRIRGPVEDTTDDEMVAPLLDCVHPGEPFVEYGVVEYRFRLARPNEFAALVRERGHVMLGAPRASTSSSTARFVRVLRRLERAGELVSVKGPGTGAWRYDRATAYWARPPRPSGPLLTWTMFCATRGRSAEWTDADKAAF